MKKIIVFIFCAISLNAIAQDITIKLGEKTEHNSESYPGVVYAKYTHANFLVSMTDINTKYVTEIWRKTDGSDMSEAMLWGEKPLVKDYEQYIVQSRKYLHYVFNKDEYPQLDGEEITVNMYIDSQTGKVEDVVFSFYTASKFNRLPVDPFIEIEKLIKENVVVELTDSGKLMTYNVVGWEEEFHPEPAPPKPWSGPKPSPDLLKQYPFPLEIKVYGSMNFQQPIVVSRGAPLDVQFKFSIVSNSSDPYATISNMTVEVFCDHGDGELSTSWPKISEYFHFPMRVGEQAHYGLSIPILSIMPKGDVILYFRFTDNKNVKQCGAYLLIRVV